ncbi:hypothetical protein C8Q76DRAFT_616247 [Earliella scabrosa]|nr:hypothetical protein C8Q76DRAFT_616247 [Earliella scabrosa]
MGDISVENAELIGLWFQLLVTGAYLVYFPQCIAVFRTSTASGKRSSIWLYLACYLIFLSTIADQVLALVRTYQAFGVHGGARPDPEGFFADPANPLAAAKNSFNIILTLISDAIIVYRTFVLWNFNVYVIILPVLAILANIALGVLTIVALLRVEEGENLIRSDISVRLRYYFVLTFILNLACAGLICWKIWRINSRVARTMNSPRDVSTGGTYTSHVLEVIIQTAGLYCAHLLVLIITDAVGTNVFFIFLDPLPPMAAIIFSMLIVRARSPSTSSTGPATGLDSISTPTSPQRLWGNRASYAARQNVPIGVTIDLERVVHTDSESVQRLGLGDAEGLASRDRISMIEAKDIGQAV